MRSFGIVEFKLFESDFFLEKLRETRNSIEAEFYFSAFLSASRSVTFALQASLEDHPDFWPWYERQQETLRKSEIATWFKNARNASQHAGETFIGTAAFTDDGRVKFFQDSLIRRDETVLEATGRMPSENWRELQPHKLSEDIAAKCTEHMKGLLTVIQSCFQTFGPVIDSEQYYTPENLLRLGCAIEDFERELGFVPGWSAGIPDERCLALLREQAGESEIDELFCKYLDVDRFGRKCDAEELNEKPE